MSVLRASRLFVSALLLSLLQYAAASSSIVGAVSVKGPDAPVGPIANAFVMVSNPAFPKQVLAVAQTDASGSYLISGLASGTYMVSFTTPGFLQGIMSSYALADGETVELNAQLVPSLTANEVAKNNVKDETAYTIHNPNGFTVHYSWQLPQHHVTGSGDAPPGDSVIDPKQWPHTENISLFVDGAQVQRATTTVVPPPFVVGNLTGVVTNTSAAPLGGVQITLSDSSNAPIGSTFSLADGSYVFPNEPAGTYTLSYALAGYLAASQTASLPSGGGQVPTEQLTPIPPPPTATVDVTVVDSDTGAPSPGAGVLISYSDGTSVNGVADGNGFIEFTKQPVGVAASVTTFAQDGSSRQALVSTSGFVAGVNALTLSLPPIPKGSISGLIDDASGGGPLAGVTVAVLDAKGNVVASTTTASDGTYSISGLSPSTYSMTFSLANYQTVSVGGVFVQSGGNASESVSLATTLASVNVTVIDGGTGADASRAYVFITYSDGTQSAQTFTDIGGLAQFTNQPSALGATVTAVDEDGTSRTASVSLPQGFVPGANSLTVTFPPAVGSISGVVTDAKGGLPLSGVTVSASDSATLKTYSTVTAADGSYTLSNLPSSKYTVAFTDKGYQTLTVPGVLVNIGVVTPESVSLTIAVQFGSVSGAVRNAANGLPLAGVGVTATDATTLTAYSGTTTLQGTYSISGLPFSTYSVTFSLSGYQTTTLPGVVVSGSMNLNTVTLASGVTPTTATVNVSVIDGGTLVPVPSSVTISYSDRTIAGPMAATNGTAQFTNQETGVVASIQATATDGSGRAGATTVSPGFVAGTNDLTITLPAAQVSVSIAGTVMDATTLAPLAKVSVTALDSSSRVVGSATSASDGSYALSGLATGTYTLNFSLSGYQTYTISGVGVQAGKTTMVPAALTPSTSSGTAIVDVYVTDGGKPSAGATVSISYSVQVPAPIRGTTDVNGFIEFTGQPANASATVTATSSDGRTVSSSIPGFPANLTTTVSLALPAATGSITGSVADASTSSLLGGVTVTVTDASNKLVTTTSTGKTGTFTVSGLTQPTYNLTFSLNGYQTQTVVANIGSKLNILLSPAASSNTANVTVTVVDVNGSPVGGAAVTIRYSDGSPTASGTTDPKGGTVSFSNQPVGPAATIQAVDPLTGNSATTVWPTLASGSNLVNLTLSGSTTGGLSGSVTYANQFLAGVNVSVVDWNSIQVASTTTDIKGNYSVTGLAAGTYTVTFSLNGYQTLSLTAAVTAGQTTPLSATLTPSTTNLADLTVTVLDGGKPYANATVTIYYSKKTPLATGSTDSNGIVRFANLAVTGSILTVSAVSLDSREGDSTLTLVSGSNSVTVNLPTPQGVVQGTVTGTDGKALPGVSVTLMDSNSQAVGSATTDGSGAYSVSGLVTGTFTATFSLAGYVTKEITVLVTNGATTTLNTTLAASTGTITGFVAGSPNVVPLANVAVTVTDANNNVVGTATTAADGTYTVSSLPLGTYTLTYTLSGYTTGSFSWNVAAPQTYTVNELLYPAPSPLASVTISVVDNATGSPVSGATVSMWTLGGSLVTQTTDASGNASFTNIPVGMSATITVTTVDGKTFTQTVPAGFVSGSNPTIIVYIG